MDKTKDPLAYGETLSALAILRAALMETDEATMLFKSCLQLRESVLGADHPAVATTLEKWAKHLPTAPDGALERARRIRVRAEAQKPLGLHGRKAAGEPVP
ncbi:MAG: tetratricopeptide repeat protein [Gemmataceae bacterium]|nr:tetratricopeptide repeat protein [Gemmataceae bacterium]